MCTCSGNYVCFGHKQQTKEVIKYKAVCQSTEENTLIAVNRLANAGWTLHSTYMNSSNQPTYVMEKL